MRSKARRLPRGKRWSPRTRRALPPTRSAPSQELCSPRAEDSSPRPASGLGIVDQENVHQLQCSANSSRVRWIQKFMVSPPVRCTPFISNRTAVWSVGCDIPRETGTACPNTLLECAARNFSTHSVREVGLASFRLSRYCPPQRKVLPWVPLDPRVSTPRFSARLRFRT